ncbi:hypothetical protein [Streptomyces sp. WAC01526]|uniref:hypothetical protein n=1 Tax=Streptomyces sp. WAC01526 TaxID=2588709 RepID=UPI0011E023EE|nr:hypothetical protein [Streptomyces sp. WAC01526]
MSSTPQTSTQRKSRRPSTGAPQWRTVRWQWRRPRFLEVTRSLTALPVVVSATGYVPEGAPSAVAAGAFAVHAVVDLASRCVRRTRG